MPIQISSTVSILDEELEIRGIHAQGKGGQNVNKVATAIHLRFDIAASSLPDAYKQRLLTLQDQRLNKNGVIVIKSRAHRTREKNKAAALARLKLLVVAAVRIQKKRRATKPTRGSQVRRMDSKTRHGMVKQTRQKYRPD